MKITIRPETSADYRAVEELTREAFWNVHVPGCDEHYLIHIMRHCSNFLPELDLVAEVDGKLVGHIAYTKASIQTAAGTQLNHIISFGPLSVLPDFQGCGVGGALVRQSLERAKEAGHDAVLIYGDPRYYARFGFRCAERYDIQTADGTYAPALMALELVPGALTEAQGRFCEAPIFALNASDAAAFDTGFPAKEKGHRESQDVFKVLAVIRY